MYNFYIYYAILTKFAEYIEIGIIIVETKNDSSIFKITLAVLFYSSYEGARGRGKILKQTYCVRSKHTYCRQI